MELFINKMRRLKGIRKVILIEEAWKAIASANMAGYIKYLYKTVRKFFGEAVVVTQEVDDIISSPVVKESIINNSDCKILLDQRKYMNKFDQIQALLGLTDKERGRYSPSIRATMPHGRTRRCGSDWAAYSLPSMPPKCRKPNTSPIRRRRPRRCGCLPVPSNSAAIWSLPSGNSPKKNSNQ